MAVLVRISEGNTPPYGQQRSSRDTTQAEISAIFCVMQRSELDTLASEGLTASGSQLGLIVHGQPKVFGGLVTGVSSALLVTHMYHMYHMYPSPG